MEKKCIICNKNAIFKIKNQPIYYCREHAKEFFTIDALENISKIEKGNLQANKLKDYIEK